MKTTINFRIESKIKDQLEILSQYNGLTISSLVRDIVEQFLEECEIIDEEYEVVDVLYMNISDFNKTE